MEIIRRIRAKQDASKARYAFAGACVITVLVGTIWASTLPARFSGVVPKKDLGASLLESTSLDTLFSQETENTAVVPQLPDAESSENRDSEALNTLGTDWDSVYTPLTNGATSTSAPTTPALSTSTPVQLLVTGAGGGTTTRATSSVPQIIMIATTTSQRPE